MMQMMMNMMGGKGGNPMSQMMNMMGGNQQGNGGMDINSMMQMMNGNPQQAMQMFSGNPMFQQAQKMMSNGGDPRQIIMNVAQQKGIPQEQLQQMANQFGIKL